jgi:signal transduction histidine kinase
MLVVGAVLLSVRRGLRPLRVLEADIASIDDSDLQHRVPGEGLPREVRPIVLQLNGLLSRLEDAFARQRAFTASAAHEFRTPLAGIRTQIEVGLRRARSSDEYQATLAQCLDGTISLQRMVDAMLDLARLDAGLTRVARQAVDVPELVRSQWARFGPLAAARGCSAILEMPDSLKFVTDRGMLDHVLSNLLGNAAEYADSGGVIQVSLALTHGSLRLAVRNPARVLDPSDVDKMFDRFWRKDAARTDTGQHCGLGLAIVARCVEAMGGQIRTGLQDGSLEQTIELRRTIPQGGIHPEEA